MTAADPSSATPPSASRQALPSAYLPVALFPTHPSALQLAIVARKTADPVAGHFVTLRTRLDAVVFLGCLIDAGKQIHGYVEIHVQSLDGLANSPAAVRETLSNRSLDDRWGRLFVAYDALPDAAGLIRTGYETAHPPPLFYDTDKQTILQPTDPISGTPWSLCTDDAALTAKGLPPYSSSLHRYLSAGGKSPYIPVTSSAPASAGTAPLAQITGPKAALIPLNPGGLMLVRTLAPIPLEPFFDLLSGGPWEGILAGRTALHLDRLNEMLDEKNEASTDMADGRLFLGKHGKWGRLTETFHLKLRLLADCFAAVRALTAQLQRPLLNLTAQSFQVAIGNGGGGANTSSSATASGSNLGTEGIRPHALPFLWTATAHLVDPGDAVTLKLDAADAQYFVRALSAPASVYQPDSVTQGASGRGTLRIRKTITESAGIILEGTFTSQDRLAEPTRNDLFWLRAPIGSQRIDLFGHIEKEPALAAGEWRFRTQRQKLSEALAAQLKAAEGVPIPETLFDVIPLLSSPCDMYSLAILSARALLVDAQTTLAIVADELLSLARQIALQHQATAPLGERIRAIFQSDTRWLNSLGPHRLTRDSISPQEAFDLVPASLWFDTMGLLVAMIPGIGPDSFCRDYGDSPRGGIHKIYDAPTKALDSLLVRTRSLIVIDWRFNREIHAVLRRFPATAPART